MKNFARYGVLIFALCSTNLYAQTSGALMSAQKFSGPSVVIHLSNSIKLNEKSKLTREYFVLRDALAPAFVSSNEGVNVSYDSTTRGASTGYQYRGTFAVQAKENIVAYEIRIHLLDVFGKHVRTLSTSTLAEVADSNYTEATWRIFQEAEAREAYTSIAYLAQARTANGGVYEVNRSALLEQIQKISSRVTASDLDPQSEIVR